MRYKRKRGVRTTVATLGGNRKPGVFYTPYPKKIKTQDFGFANGNKLTKDSTNLAKAGLSLAFLGLTLGIATRAFNNISK
ncbi:MAG: hypothetical protein ACHQ1D_00995 [Nitrososphaerales archaeon]